MSSPGFGILTGSLRDRAVATEPQDTVAGFRSAAVRRWEDGMALLGQSGCETASVYLMGYAAELALKIAVCELFGVPPSTDPWGWIRPQRITLGITLRDVRTHDILSLWTQVALRREGLGLDVRDPAFHGTLQFYASIVYTNWWEELRYKNERASLSEAVEVAEASFWLLTNLEAIYR